MDLALSIIKRQLYLGISQKKRLYITWIVQVKNDDDDYLQNSWCSSSSSCSWLPSASQCGQDHRPSGVSSSSGSKHTKWYARGHVSHSMISPPC